MSPRRALAMLAVGLAAAAALRAAQRLLDDLSAALSASEWADDDGNDEIGFIYAMSDRR